MTKNSATIRPKTLRRQATAVALSMTAAIHAAPATAQDQQEEEVELETLRIEDRAADVNPYTAPGAPYKAEISGDPRRVKPLSETPATITVITETQIEEAGVSDLRDIVDAQPGITVGTGENGNAFGDRYIIRGQEARSDVFVDGLRDPGMTTRESFAVEQIEVTKGPSASFAGRGTTGGAINSITKQASTDYNFNRIDVGAGTDEYARATLDSNWSLSDSVAVRANLLYSTQDVPDRAPANRERWGVAISGTAQLSDSVRILLDYYHLTAKDAPDLGSYVTASDADGYGVPYDDIPAYTQEEDFLNSEVDTFTGRIFIEPFDSFKIHSITRYGTTSNGYVTTGARGGENGASIGLSTHQGWQDVEYFAHQTNVIADFETGSLSHALIVGMEYSDLQVINGNYTNPDGSRLGPAGASNCTVNGRGGAQPGYCLTDANGTQIADSPSTLLGRQIVRAGSDSNWEVDTMSLYLMDTVDITPWLAINGGIRMDSFTYSNSVIGFDGSSTDYGYSDTLWNGHAGVTVKPHEEGIIYFNWSTAKNINGGESDLGSNCGYGGLCVTDDVPLGNGLPESSTSFELGTKWDLFDDRLLLTAAVFQLTKSNIYEIGRGNNGYAEFGTINTGKHRVRGFELGLVGNLTDKLSGQIGVTIMDAEILESFQPELVGLTLSNFADTSATAQLRYQASDAFAFGGTLTYQSEMFTGQPDTAPGYNAAAELYSYRVPDYVVADVFASYRFNSHFQARVNVSNVGDNDYYLAGYRSGAFLYKGDERRATLTLTGRF